MHATRDSSTHVRRLTQDAAKRFWSKVEKTDSCWLWRASLTYDGYAKFWLDGASIGGHRWSYEQAHGAIRDGMTIDHLCRVRSCVNPAHLEVVTIQENLRRRNAERTHCANGHMLSGDNIARDRDGWKRCRRCRSDAQRRRRAHMNEAGLSTRGKALKR